MPYISGPVSVVVVSGVLILALIFWLKRDRRHPGPRLYGADGIDRETLEEAEREVRELEAGALPDEERLGDDWGPGTGTPRPPTRL